MLWPLVHVPVIFTVRVFPVPARLLTVIPAGTEIWLNASVVGTVSNVSVSTVVVTEPAVPLADTLCSVLAVGALCRVTDCGEPDSV